MIVVGNCLEVMRGIVAANRHQHGTGGLNIDACRIETNYSPGGGDQSSAPKVGPDGLHRPWMEDGQAKAAHADRCNANVAKAEALGRWPANLIHDGSEEVLEAFSTAPGQQGDLRSHSRDRVSLGIYGDMGATRDAIARADSCSAVRFFYCAKATREVRNDGLDSGPVAAVSAGATMRDRETANWPERNGNHHPTVNPTNLVRHPHQPGPVIDLPPHEGRHLPVLAQDRRACGMVERGHRPFHRFDHESTECGSKHGTRGLETKKAPANRGLGIALAERVGFEPTEGLTLRRFSRPVP